MRSWNPRALVRTALTPIALFAGYLLVMVAIFVLGVPNEVESVLLALLWFAGLAAAVRVGFEYGRRVPAQPVWLSVAAAVTVSSVVTPLLERTGRSWRRGT